MPTASVHASSLRASITGSTAAEIAESVRTAVERGAFAPGDALPAVRALADQLGVNRNTVVAAYRQLGQAGLVDARGRSGTRVAGVTATAQEGFARGTVLRDVGSGNPDPRFIPNPTRVLARVAGRPVLYGEPVIDPALESWALEWMREAVGPDRDIRLTITGGASDAIERLLAHTLTRDDAVALEDPCFLTSMHTVRLAGYRPLAVPVDAEGMTVSGLEAALAAGARAVVCTPRAQNPTGASLTASRAAALRGVLAKHPYVLVIEDDHFSMLSTRPLHSIVGPAHQRFALVRSVSKFLGPDMCLAVAASDPETAARLATRLTPGTTWVSHLLQRLTHALVSDTEVHELITAASRHYAERNAAFAERLGAHGLPVSPGDGVSLWVPLPVPARGVVERLMRRGWLARSGDDFALTETAPPPHLRLTVHDLDPADADRLALDVAQASGA